MTTLDELDQLDAILRRMQRGPSLPAMPASARAVERLSAQDAAPAVPAQSILDALRRDLKTREKKRNSFSDMTNREFRLVPWLLWSNEDPLAALPGLLEEVVARAARRKSILRVLIEAWLQGYRSGADKLREASLAISQLISKVDHGSIVSWRRLDGRLGLFQAPNSPKRFATWLLSSRDTGSADLSIMLKESGFDDPMRAASGYMRAVQDEVLLLAPDTIATSEHSAPTQRILEFLRHDKRLRFHEPIPAGAVARSLLTPWLRKNADIDEAKRQLVQQFLLAYLGDPRLRPAFWDAAGPEATALMKRWLTKASLDAFFSIIREHALDGHWRYREAFWGAYLRASLIDDAWLALGPDAYADARTVRELHSAYGRLEGDGIQSNHSVLLVQIGDLIFSEWSHSGKLRAWPTGWPDAPKLAKSRYSRYHLTKKCLPFPANRLGRGGNSNGSGLSHFSSDSGYWQESVISLIYQ
jgi:hypothetical protein